MAFCYKCGEPIEFFHDGFQAIPVHLSGSCGGRGGDGWNPSSLRSTSSGAFFEFPFVTFPSYVNPNARCPVCGESVYFYQSPYGGRVFFDELGPPWPKHPCTDNEAVRQHLSTPEGRAKVLDQKNESVLRQQPLAWVENGWMPFVVTKLVPCSVGFIADGTLFTSAAEEGISFRISQESPAVIYCRRHGEVEFGYNLVQNVGTILSVLNEAPIMLKRNPEWDHLLLSSFILTEENEVEEVTVPVVGTRILPQAQ